MEDGCTLSSSDNNQFVDAEMELFLPNLESSDLQHLKLEGDRLAWKSSLDSLKSFVMCDLQQQGKWTSPGLVQLVQNMPEMTTNMPDSNTSTTAEQSKNQTVSPSMLSEDFYASGIQQASADREGQESSTRE